MRKFIFIALAVLLVMSFTALAVAEDTQIKLGGRILVRGWYFDNILNVAGISPFEPSGSDLGIPAGTSSQALYTTNAYLTVDAKIMDNLQAYMELETGDTALESAGIQSGLYKWGTTDAKADAELFFRQLWIQYSGIGLLGVPAGIKVGHQLLTLGEKQFYNQERFGTDAVVLYVEPTKELSLAVLTAKQKEGDYTLSGDDIDTNVILGTYKIDKDNTLGLYFADVETDDLTLAAGVADSDGLSLYNLGAHANGKLWNALTYAAEVDWQFGGIDAREGTGAVDSDFTGWGIMAKLGYTIPDYSLTLRGSFAMGSGDDNADDDEIGEFQFIGSADTESRLARFPHYTQIYERSIVTSSFNQLITGAFPNRSSGIANTTYYNLGLDFLPMKDLSLSLDGFYLFATDTGALEQIVGRPVDDGIGWEVDFKGTWKIAKNLSYFVEAAYFDAGDFYGDPWPQYEEKSVTQLVHGLNITF